MTPAEQARNGFREGFEYGEQLVINAVEYLMFVLLALSVILLGFVAGALHSWNQRKGETE